MEVLSQLLGHHARTQRPFILFKFPHGDKLMFRLADIQSLFNLPSLQQPLASIPSLEGCHSDATDCYIDARLLSVIAIRHRRFLLAELCKLTPANYGTGLANVILDRIPTLKRQSSDWESVQLDLSPLDHATLLQHDGTPRSPPIKTEPLSPHYTDGEAKSLTRRRSIQDDPTRKRLCINVEAAQNATHLPKPLHTVSSQAQERMPSLLSKRMAKKNAPNLTIMAPSYDEQLTGIRSAPLHPRQRPLPAPSLIVGSDHPPGPQQGQKHTGVPLTSRRGKLPGGEHDFAVPPVVPSQQQSYPRTATFGPSSLAFPSSTTSSTFVRPPLSSQPPATATAAVSQSSSFARTNGILPTTAAVVPLPPQTPTTTSFAALQRQQYLQPFDHLFDTIETTRSLKTTLDDQIRRSSMLMQTLQASATTIEGLVRNQVKEAQRDVMVRLEDTMQGLLLRMDALEAHAKKNGVASVRPSPPATALAPLHNTANDEVRHPPAIVRSQHDFGPHEFHSYLNTLRERLDRLERQIES